MFFQISFTDIIHRENTVFAAAFDRHICNRKTIVHGKMPYAVPGKFHRLIQSAVYADHADNMKNDVFSADPFRRFAGQMKPDRGRNFKPCLPGRHTCRHIGTPHTRGKRAQRAVRTGMGIRSDNYVSGNGKPLFRQKRMFDPHFSYVKIIGDFMPCGKFSDTFTVLGRFNVLIRNKMIQHKCNLILIKYAVCLHLFHLVNGNRRSNVIAEYEI